MQAISVDSPETKLVISAIITRADNPNLAIKVSEINTKLSQICATNNWDFISRENILDLQVSYVGGEAQKNILLVLLWAPANVGEKHSQVCPKRLVASQELMALI